MKKKSNDFDFDDLVNEIEQSAKRPPKDTADGLYVSTSSTLLNLGLTGDPDKGFLTGKYYWFVGESDSGKTFLTRGCLAEAAINPAFANYALLEDNPEDGALMPVAKFWPRLVDRLEPLRKDKRGRPVMSQYVEDFLSALIARLKEGQPLIAVLDSADALLSKGDKKQTDDDKGSYGTGKAKAFAAYLPEILHLLKQTNSILIIISQLHDNIGRSARYQTKKASGGHALKYYATAQLWSTPFGKIKSTAKGQPRQAGINALVDIKKNRLTGREWSAIVPIYWSNGVDDIGSLVDYLVEEKHWTKADKGGSIEAPEFDFRGRKERLIQYIEDNQEEDTLKQLVTEVYQEIIEACTPQRRNRYA